LKKFALVLVALALSLFTIPVSGQSFTAELDLVEIVRWFRHRNDKQSGPTCGIRTVSYIFQGKPGTPFRFSEEDYILPGGGKIELIAHGDEQVIGPHGPITADRINVLPIGPFGDRLVQFTDDEGGESDPLDLSPLLRALERPRRSFLVYGSVAKSSLVYISSDEHEPRGSSGLENSSAFPEASVILDPFLCYIQ